MESLSLWDIEAGLSEVLSAREEADTAAEQDACDLAIKAYVEGEVAKVEGIAHYLAHCRVMAAAAKEERDRLRLREITWNNRRKRLLEFTQRVMESREKRRIEGRTCALVLKDNGGRQPVDVQGWDKERKTWIEDAGLVPDDLCTVTVTFRADIWKVVQAHLELEEEDSTGGVDPQPSARTPNFAAIYDVLSMECGDCLGLGYIEVPEFDGCRAPCDSCGGTGRLIVPGCTLLPRGSHVEVK